MTRVGFLGLGEAGSLIAADLASTHVAAASEAWLGELAAEPSSR